MEGRTGSEGRVWPGKTISPRPTNQKAWAYRNFKIGELFTAQTGDTDLQQKDVNGNGVYLINSGVDAQGIKGKTDRQAKVFKSNTITIDFWGNAYYRDFEYKMATHNHVFSLSGNVIKNRMVGLYLVSTMSYMRKLFSYNNMGTWTKIKELSILLPILQSGDIDFAFMESRIREMEESRIREMEESRIREMEAYLKVAGFENCELTSEEQAAEKRLQIGKVRMQYFKLSSLYEKVSIKNKPFDKRKDTSQQKSAEYSLPLINAKHGDNGIMFYGKEDIFPSVEMTIDIVQNGAIATGDVYAQPQKTGVLWDAYLIKAIAHTDTINTLLYFACVIEKTIKQKFSYDNKAVWDRVKAQKILLPVNESNQIDFQFMNLYINAQMKLSIQKVKDWRAKEIDTTKKVVRSDVVGYQAKPQMSYDEWQMKNDAPKMVAEDIVIPGSLEVRLKETKREELLSGNLDLVLMYAIGPVARKNTESAGKIALGIKEENLSVEAIKAYESINYVMFHYWKNSEATPFKLTSPTRLVSKEDIPEEYLVRQEKDASQYLLLEYDTANPAEFGEYDILKVQRKGTSRYLPFVCKVDSLRN